MRLFMMLLVLAASLNAGPVPLDREGEISVEIAVAKGRMTATTRASAALSAKGLATVCQGLALEAGGQSLKPGADGAWAGALALGAEPVACRLSLFGHPMATFKASAETMTRVRQVALLSAFELRRFGQRGAEYAPEWARTNAGLGRSRHARVDLHTHFGGALRARTILEVADQLALPYPTALLDEIGVTYPAGAVVSVGGKPHVPLTRAHIGEAGQARLEQRLSIRPGQVETFMNMEDCYRFRTPLVKSVPAFGRYLEALARDYDETGVSYAELSISDILKPEWLAEAHRVLPRIERETGVMIRFLAAVWRHSDPVYNDDLVAKIQALSGSPYIVGVDFMGHETNSTRAFVDTIKKLAEYKKTANPAFVIRVHAGENPLFPENVREAINAGATRIGHGLYGMDAQALQAAAAQGVIVEFNLNSNLALNNIGGPGDVPIKAYFDAGVRVTLGTDGHGLYHTTKASEEAAARLAHLTEADLERVQASDRTHVERMEGAFKQKFAAGLSVPTSLPAPRYTPEYSARVENERKERLAALKAGVAARKIRLVDASEVPAAFPDMTPVLFSGASAKSWALISPANQAKVEEMVDAVIARLDPKRAFVVTGATDFGVEKIVHAKARAAGLSILGTIVEDTVPGELGPITHAVVMGQTWYDKSARVLALVRDLKGTVIFAGGGNILKDEIQAATNGHISYHLMEGPEGAAHDACAVWPHAKFRNVPELMGQLEARIGGCLKSAGAASATRFFRELGQLTTSTPASRAE